MLMFRLPVNSRIKIKDSLEESPLRILPGDILISRSGTVGTSVLCGESYSSHIASDDCFRVRIAENMRGYVAAFLASPLGKVLLTRDSHGKVIKHLKDHDILNCLVPIIQNSKLQLINQLMLESVDLIDKARQLLVLAESKLYNALNISPSIDSPELWLNLPNKTFTISSRNLFHARLDPHFNEPSIGHLRNTLSTMPHRTLGVIADVWGVSRFKRLRADKSHGTPLYSSADIIRAKVKPSAYLSPKRNARNIQQCQIEKGTILIPCSGAFGGILGRSVLAGNTLDRKSVTQHVLRIKVKHPDYITEYVSAFLGSLKLGYPIITAFRYGKDVPEIDPNELKSIPVPTLAREIQEDIAQHTRETWTNIDRANELQDESQKELLASLEWDENEGK
jgi:restriction endonuclease S subunit